MNNEPVAQNEIAPADTQMNDDEVLSYTRGIRIGVVKELMAGNKSPTETGDRILLTSMLKDLDVQALSSKKLATDEKRADNTAAIVAELLRNIDKRTMFTTTHDELENVIDTAACVVPNTIPDMPALPGEMDVNPPQLDYASFVRSQGKDVDQLGRDTNHPEDKEDDLP